MLPAKMTMTLQAHECTTAHTLVLMGKKQLTVHFNINFNINYFNKRFAKFTVNWH